MAPQPSPDVTVLCWQEPTRSDLRARQIAEFLGAAVAWVSLPEPDAARLRAVQRPQLGGCVVVHADTLVRAAATLACGADDLPAFLGDGSERVFVYGFRPERVHAEIARVLSEGTFDRVEAPAAITRGFRVAEGERQWCQQFSGLTVEPIDRGIDNGFVESASPGRYSMLIEAAGRPFFVRLQAGRTELFLLACSELADLDQAVPASFPVLRWFSRLAPLAMFLRGALGARLWHHDRPRACFVIDDPLLNRDRYGFLDYSSFIADVSDLRCSASIAFIPWNYRRTRRQVAAALAGAAGSISLCVHGCDHTSAEFAAREVEVVRSRAQLALRRMSAHRDRFGLPFDDVMVFPQGLFSTAALHALGDCGYLAAVNTAVCPIDLPAPLTLRESLDVAIATASDFPVFGRRYPRELAEFAFDLFLGRPALAVEHHTYFRQGDGAFRRFVTALSGLDRGLEWASLAHICSSACRKRLAANGDVHVRFYTDRFSVSNRDEQPRTFVLFRRCVDRPRPSLAIDGERAELEQQADDLTFTLTLAPGQIAQVRLASERFDVTLPPSNRGGFRNAGVLVRRALCEFRDNHVDTSNVLSGLVAGVRTLLPHARRRTPQSLCTPGR
jgi:hypothetical protein